MARLRNPVRLIAITILCVCGLAALSYTKTDAKAVNKLQEQNVERVVKMTSIRNAPITLSDLKIGDFSIKNREKLIESRNIAEWKEWGFSGNDSWLNSFRLTFKNVSGKPIVAITIELLISHPRLPHPLAVPLSPNRRVPLFLSRIMGETTSWETLQPNEEITYSLRPATINLIAGQLKAVGAPTAVSEIEIDPGRIQFDYDSGWNDGQIFRRDPNNPEVWQPEKSVGPLL